MEDTDLMPFGKYSKAPDGPLAMANVPASYLLWLKDNASAGVRTAYPKVFEYIDDCKDALQKEVEK